MKHFEHFDEGILINDPSSFKYILNVLACKGYVMSDSLQSPLSYKIDSDSFKHHGIFLYIKDNVIYLSDVPINSSVTPVHDIQWITKNTNNL